MMNSAMPHWMMRRGADPTADARRRPKSEGRQPKRKHRENPPHPGLRIAGHHPQTAYDVDVVRQQVAPFEALPVPDGVIDIDHWGSSHGIASIRTASLPARGQRPEPVEDSQRGARKEQAIAQGGHDLEAVARAAATHQ